MRTYKEYDHLISHRLYSSRFMAFVNSKKYAAWAIPLLPHFAFNPAWAVERVREVNSVHKSLTAQHKVKC